MRRDVGVVLVAAGRGRRVGGTQPKQYRPLGGIPMLLRALSPFASHPEVAHTVVTLPPADLTQPPGWLTELVGSTLTVVAGGAKRSDSVAAGLAALPGECLTVLVHDAARPLISRDLIDAVIAVARQGEGAVPALPLTDTVKEADRDEGDLRIARTLPRQRLWRAQTPQGFPRPMLEAAYARARGEGATATDDAALVERLGQVVRLVPGSPRNLKVTTEEDFRLAELLL